MKSGWSCVFPCSNCGAHNVTGAKYCGNCGLSLYYNCPDCQAWVDVTFSHCPNCDVKLDWPNGAPVRASSPAVMLLLLGIAMLVTGGLYLMVNSSGPANAVAGKSASATASTSPSNTLPAINAPQSLPAKQQGSNIIDTPDPAGYSWYDAPSSYIEDPGAYEVVLTIPAATTQVTDTSVSNTPGRSYLETVYPTWGHCVGGSCRNVPQ